MKSKKKRKKKQNNINNISKSFFLNDGIIRYDIKINPYISCVCKINLKHGYCKHLLAVLNKYFLFDAFIIWGLRYNEVYCTFKDLMESDKDISEYSKVLDDCIFEKFKGHDCGICCDPLIHHKFKMRLYECIHCNKFAHSKCIENWYQEHNKKSKLEREKRMPEYKCIYCRQ